jgi:hypothetical protein
VVKWIIRPRTKRGQSPKVEQTKQTGESSEDDIEEAVLMDAEED